MAQEKTSPEPLPEQPAQAHFQTPHGTSTGTSLSRPSTGKYDSEKIVSQFYAVKPCPNFDPAILPQMVSYLLRRCEAARWFETARPSLAGFSEYGTFIRQKTGNQLSEPSQVRPELMACINRINPAAAFTMSSEITMALLERLSPQQKELVLRPGALTIPIINSLAELAAPETDLDLTGYALIVRSEAMIIVWQDTVDTLYQFGSELETMLLGVLWTIDTGTPFRQSPARLSIYRNRGGRPHASRLHSNVSSQRDRFSILESALEKEGHEDEEIFDPDDEEALKVPKRPMVLTHSFMIALAICGLVVVQTLSIQSMITETLLDGVYYRWALVAVIPAMGFFATVSSFHWSHVIGEESNNTVKFFFVVIVGNLFQIFGPISDVMINSKYHSGKTYFKNLKGKKIAVHLTYYSNCP
jgi:hypothetical protein